jgi:hypothetical protein
MNAAARDQSVAEVSVAVSVTSERAFRIHHPIGRAILVAQDISVDADAHALSSRCGNSYRRPARTIPIDKSAQRSLNGYGADGIRAGAGQHGTGTTVYWQPTRTRDRGRDAELGRATRHPLMPLQRERSIGTKTTRPERLGPIRLVNGRGFAGASMSIAKPRGGSSRTALLPCPADSGRFGVMSESVQPARVTAKLNEQKKIRPATHPIRQAGAVLTCGRRELLATVLC